MSELNVEIARLMEWRETSPSTPSYRIPPGEQLATNVPRYDSDPAAALGLLDHLQTFRAVSRGKSMPDGGAVKFTIYRDRTQIVEWSIWRGPSGFADHEKLETAIALACRDALVALRGDDDAADKANEEAGA